MAEMSEVQVQLSMKRLKVINGEPVKIPDVSRWEKVKKYVDHRNLSKLTREDLELIAMKLYPLYVTIEGLEESSGEQIAELSRQATHCEYWYCE